MECGKIEEVCLCKSEVLTVEQIYVVDLKGATGAGEIQAYDAEPRHESVLLNNVNQLPVKFVAFEENAFKIKKGKQAKQCECLFHPYVMPEDTWMLFIEMKYANNENNIQRDKWHEKAVEQIRSTVGFLKQKGVIAEGVKHNAIVAFPKISTFSAWLTQYISNELKKDNIIARCTNKATIVDGKILILA